MIAQRILNRLAQRLAAALAPPSMPLLRLVVDGSSVGWLDGARALRLARFVDVFDVTDDTVRVRAALRPPRARSDALDAVARTLAAEGALTRWRDERYAVRCAPNAPPLFLLERAAARYFGITTEAAHVNATALREGELCMWIARRSAAKPIDPGQLDNLVGGGLAAGTTVAATVVKEAWEEAGIAADIARTARPAGVVRIFRAQPDGIQDETIHVHDLDLARDFAPANQDGEVAAFRLEPIDRVAELAGNDSGEDVVTADAALVIADWLLRHGHVPRNLDVYVVLGDLMRRGSPRAPPG